MPSKKKTVPTNKKKKSALRFFNQPIISTQTYFITSVDEPSEADNNNNNNNNNNNQSVSLFSSSLLPTFNSNISNVLTALSTLKAYIKSSTSNTDITTIDMTYNHIEKIKELGLTLLTEFHPNKFTKFTHMFNTYKGYLQLLDFFISRLPDSNSIKKDITTAMEQLTEKSNNTLCHFVTSIIILAIEDNYPNFAKLLLFPNNMNSVFWKHDVVRDNFLSLIQLQGYNKLLDKILGLYFYTDLKHAIQNYIKDKEEYAKLSSKLESTMTNDSNNNNVINMQSILREIKEIAELKTLSIPPSMTANKEGNIESDSDDAANNQDRPSPFSFY